MLRLNFRLLWKLRFGKHRNTSGALLFSRRSLQQEQFKAWIYSQGEFFIPNGIQFSRNCFCSSLRLPNLYGDIRIARSGLVLADKTLRAYHCQTKPHHEALSAAVSRAKHSYVSILYNLSSAYFYFTYSTIQQRFMITIRFSRRRLAHGNSIQSTQRKICL